MTPGSSKRLVLTLAEEISAGTLARVYRAEAHDPSGRERVVAVKVLRDRTPDGVADLARTRDEARLLARFQHRHIVRVEEVFELEGHPAVVMEFVEGMNVQQLVETLRGSGRPFSPRAALEIAAATASALDVALRGPDPGTGRAPGIVHRDLKPSSLMVTQEGELKVLDFATAVAPSPERTLASGMVRFASWRYMAPERKQGASGDHASDVCSLGLLLTELLSPEPLPALPAPASEHDAVLRAHAARLGPLGMPDEAWTSALTDLLLQMTSSAPGDRPTAEPLVEVLRQYAGQAAGASLADLAASVVRPWVANRLPSPSEGDLCGRRFWIPIDSPTPPIAERADVPRPARLDDEPPTTVPGTPWTPHPTIAPRDDVPPPPPVAETGLDAPRPLGRIALAPVPRPQVPPLGVTLAPAPPPVVAPAPPPVVAPAPPPVVAPAPRMPVIRGPIARDPHAVDTSYRPMPTLAPLATGPTPRRRRTWIWIAVGVVLLGMLGLLVLVGAGVAWYALSHRASPPDRAPDPVEVEPAAPAAPSGSAPFTVEPGDPAVQWIEVRAGDAAASRARGTFSGTVPPGPCTLTVKVVGRAAASGTVDVGPEGLALTCIPVSRGRVQCSRQDGAPPLTLGS